MPELPEVERAAALLRTISVGKKVTRVETLEDTIVYTGGVSHTDFASELVGRTVKNAGRYGKVLYLELDGEGRQPVLHFGMTGMLQVKGELPTYYKETPKNASTDWPPRFMKFILHLGDDTEPEATQVAFLDARRLGRIRLCASPLKEPPISLLGFDPILCMADLDHFQKLVLKRSCPVKVLLLDQSFSAGVGNWVADEILYHARIHPEQRCNTLTTGQLVALHKETADVCRIAVGVNADDTKFPENWLFKHRWGKGKKEKHTLKLPSGEPATIKWLTVGGRTSAVVSELQRLPGKLSLSRKAPDEDEESDLTALSESDREMVRPKKRKMSIKREVSAKKGLSGKKKVLLKKEALLKEDELAEELPAKQEVPLKEEVLVKEELQAKEVITTRKRRKVSRSVTEVTTSTRSRAREVLVAT